MHAGRPGSDHRGRYRLQACFDVDRSRGDGNRKITRLHLGGVWQREEPLGIHHEHRLTVTHNGGANVFGDLGQHSV
jgi:hypothetical protein